MKKNLGFTLIELLVVISIIGFLATASIVVLNSTRVKARNNKRNQDVKQLMTAFALAADNADGTVPPTNDAWYCVSSSCYGGWSGYIANSGVDAFTAPYIKKPADPSDSTRGLGGYLYINSTVSNYGQGVGPYLHWLLESVTNTPGVCGPGFFYAQSGAHAYCMLKLSF